MNIKNKFNSCLICYFEGSSSLFKKKFDRWYPGRGECPKCQSRDIVDYLLQLDKSTNSEQVLMK